MEKFEVDKFVPLGDRVLVEFHAEEKVTKGGIVLPDMARNKKLSRGTVLVCGPDCKLTKPEMVVYFGQYSGVEVDLGGQERNLVIFEKDILGFRANTGRKD